MGQPAARLGDQTAHGGTIVVGFPQVLIGGQPAARVGDTHVCPMVNPGVPPPPHVGGAIVQGSMTVLIGNMPAARLGDPVACPGPPNTIVAGCPSVLIGDSPSGGAGAGGPGGGQGGSGAPSVAAESGVGAGAGGAGGGSGAGSGHYLNVTFVDKGGYPISGIEFRLTSPAKDQYYGKLTGTIKRLGVVPGNYDIELRAVTSAKWSKTTAKVGEKVKMLSETAGIKSGEKARFGIMVRDNNFPDRLLSQVDAKVQGDKIEAEWELVIDKKFLEIQERKLKAGGYSSPSYYFVVKVAGLTQRSNLLEFKDDFEFKLKDEQGSAIADKKYRLYLPSGEVREGKLDGSGHTKETDVPPGKLKVFADVKDDSFNQSQS